MRTELASGSLPRERHWTCARRLRERRTALGLTQVEVAQVLRRRGLDLSNRALSAMEHGHAPDLGWLPELAAALDCTTTYLLGLTENPHDWHPAAAPNRPEFPGAAPTEHPVEPDRPPASTPDPEATSASVPVLTSASAAANRGWILGPDVPDRRPGGR